MKKRTATITFHASHNYGSMLQAYALQQTLLSLGVDNEIINFRSKNQLKIYASPLERQYNWKIKILRAVLNIFFPLYCTEKSKYNLFEKFLKDYLILTEEFSTSEEIKNNLKTYDYYITGSDQCWNTRCSDFDWAYYLDFTTSNNKISYASSMGPINHEYESDKVKQLLSGFKAISVREQGSSDMVSDKTEIDIEILPDPTLLLSAKEWKNLIDPTPLIDYPYIFIYTPYRKAGFNKMAVKIAKDLNLPIVVSNISSYKGDILLNIRNKHIKYELNIGPREFLNLIYNSSFVVCGSFHALVFSILFHKSFFAYQGNNDNRMKGLLNITNLEDRSIDFSDYDIKIKKAYDNIYKNVDEKIDKQKEKAFDYLKRALDIR